MSVKELGNREQIRNEERLKSWHAALTRNVQYGAVHINVPSADRPLAERGEREGLWKVKNRSSAVIHLVPTDDMLDKHKPENKEKVMAVKKGKGDAPAKKPSTKKPSTKKPSTKKTKAGAPTPTDGTPKPRGRKITYPNDLGYKVLSTTPKTEEKKAELVGAKPGTHRFEIRCLMLNKKCKTIGDLRAFMKENGRAFNNADFGALVDGGHIELNK